MDHDLLSQCGRLTRERVSTKPGRTHAPTSPPNQGVWGVWFLPPRKHCPPVPHGRGRLVGHQRLDAVRQRLAAALHDNLRFQAINQLESANPGLVVSVTIPTFPTGPDFNGDAFLQQAKTDGTNISVINVMAMDYYGSFDSGGANMGSYATEAAQDTLSFVKTIWPNDTYANIGVTPMIGQNYDSAEVFTEANAQTLVSFASSNHLGRLAFWSEDRDQPCGGSVSGLPSCSEISQQPLDFTKIFVKFTG
jgi:hypothetical protein